MIDWIRASILTFLWPQLHAQIVQIVRSESYKYFQAHNEGQNKMVAAANELQNSRSESVLHHKEHIEMLQAIAEAIKTEIKATSTVHVTT